MNLVDPAIDRYLAAFAASGDSVLDEMEAIARHRDFPIVGPQVGRLLAVLARAIGARQVVELGSGFGYSAIWFLKGMPEDGRVVMTEGSAENSESARTFLERAGYSGRYDARVGDGLALVSDIPGPVDVVFCDIDKEDYPKALPVARRLLRPGGLFVVDNLLWDGLVLKPPQGDAVTAGIVELTRLLKEAADFATTIVPVRDGVSVSVRL